MKKDELEIWGIFVACGTLITLAALIVITIIRYVLKCW